jgi:hypothetical protein
MVSSTVATRHLVAQPRCLTLFSSNRQVCASATTFLSRTPFKEASLLLKICSIIIVGAGLSLIVTGGIESDVLHGVTWFLGSDLSFLSSRHKRSHKRSHKRQVQEHRTSIKDVGAPQAVV